MVYILGNHKKDRSIIKIFVSSKKRAKEYIEEYDLNSMFILKIIEIKNKINKNWKDDGF